MYCSKISNNGNLITSTTAILIVSLVLMVIFIVNSIDYMENQNIDSIASDSFKYTIDDYSRNIEVLARESIAEETEKVYKPHIILDSRKDIKKILDKKLKNVNEEYKKNHGIDIRSEVVSVENTDSPWKVLFKVRVKADKDTEAFDSVIERNCSIEGLKDPLPYNMLPLSSLLDDGETIYYTKYLTAYLLANGVKSPESYFLATSPAVVKKCPYDPYTHHGDGDTLKNCLKNGYFHESSDGSCYLCRLEGKAVCPHYGMEVFIQPHTPFTNDTVSCVDHVVFHDRYDGKKLSKIDPDSLILDSSHKKKYGLN